VTLALGSRGEPERNCPRCPRLVAFREHHRIENPSFHNAPVPTWLAGENGQDRESVQLLVIGLAPGLKGANQTGRPFTGDWAGDLLYATLTKFDFAKGQYGATPKDGLELTGCGITNAVRCVPPQNKPVGEEINTCRPFLATLLEGLPNLRALVTLGKISHDSTLRTLKARVAAHPFTHAGKHDVGGYRIFSSYHCSRYNTNTGRLTTAMFEDVFSAARTYLDGNGREN